MTIVPSLMTENPCYKVNRVIEVKGLMLHSVGTPQPKASVFIRQWNDPSYSRACVHAFIDAENGNVYQTLPWAHRGWHCGGQGNNTHIGVEMCEPSQIKYTGGSSFTISSGAESAVRTAIFKTYNSAVELFAQLCDTYHLDPLASGVIISHAEGYARGIATNHGDPEHLWKGAKVALTMDGFRKAVSEQLKTIQNGSQISENTPFLVKVSIDNLNIRTGPGQDYKSLGHTGVGTFTIVETDGNWGLLKAYAKERNGWISLRYAKRV